ncbi:MAG: helix-turn-helix domain-containing protein [Spirochaetaceae bacterium]|nr:helix-turn-helix domain-containing protein [Spirochaetaceae bacterium]
MTVNERIRELRCSLRLSQRAFAKAVYVSNGYLAGIELGNNEVKDRLIHLISTTFSANKHWLLTGEGCMFNSTTEKKMERMTSLFNELYPEYQDFVLRQIDELIELQNIKYEKTDKK